MTPFMVRRRRTGRLSFLGLPLILSSALSCSAPPEAGMQPVETVLIGTGGSVVGSAILEETPAGVRVTVDIEDLKAGEYRYLFYDTPACDPPDFMTVGNPYPEGAATGMLENMSPALSRSVGRLTVGDNGEGRASAIAPVVTLGTGSNSLLEGGGSALVISEVRAGGERRACGLVRGLGKEPASRNGMSGYDQ